MPADIRVLIEYLTPTRPPAETDGAGRVRCQDPLKLVAAALAGCDPEHLLTRAAELATTGQERQTVAIAAAYLRGDADQVDVLTRDHLADHPADRIVGWIAAQQPT